MSMLITIRAELLKTKHTAAFYHTLVSAALIPIIFLLNIFTHGLPDENASVKDPLNSIFSTSVVMNTVAIFPLFVVVLTTLLAQIEYRNQTWKQVLSAPNTRASIFISKFLTVQMLMLLFLVATHAFMWIVAVVAHYKLPELNVLHRPLDVAQILGDLSTMYISTLALCTIQFWLSLRFRNFIVGIVVGLSLWLTGSLVALELDVSFAKYFPYSLPSLSIKLKTTAFNGTSLIYAAVVLIIGYLDFRRSEKA